MNLFKRKKKVDITKDDDATEVTFEDVIEEPEISIDEKIKFWQEQEKLNKEMVPRVLKNHERIDGVETSVETLAAKVDEQEKIIKELRETESRKIHELFQCYASFDDQMKSMKGQLLIMKLLLALMAIVLVMTLLW